MDKISEFPIETGTYVAVSKGIIALCKIIGLYPMLEIKEVLNITKFFDLLEPKTNISDKELKNSLSLDRENWMFFNLKCLTSTDGLKASAFYRECEINYDESLDLFKMYCRLIRDGISGLKMIDIIRVRTNCTRDEALKLVNHFDEKVYAYRRSGPVL